MPAGRLAFSNDDSKAVAKLPNCNYHSLRRTGEGLNASFDKEMLRRLDEMENLPEEEKKLIFNYIDLVIRDYKTKAAYTSK